MSDNGMDRHPKVFISYSWSDKDHEEWTLMLAERLVVDGVDVVIDKWSLKEGQNKYAFMESMVTDESVERVLVILDEGYKNKADHHKGGVGAETQIISPEIYSKVSQTKFIPVVAKKDECGSPFVPAYLHGNIYIDLSNHEEFEQEYEKLIRNIYGRSLYQKPPIGAAPKHIFEDKKPTSRIDIAANRIRQSASSNRDRLVADIKDFHGQFMSELETHRMRSEAESAVDFGKKILDDLNDLIGMRNLFIDTMLFLARNVNNPDAEILANFFEDAIRLYGPPKGVSTWRERDFDNFKFLVSELFLYFVSSFLKYEQYEFVGQLLHREYFYYPLHSGKIKHGCFPILRHGVSGFDQYYRKAYAKKFISPSADLMLSRVNEEFTSDELISCDLLLHYVSLFVSDDISEYWFPFTYIYGDEVRMELLQRMISTTHFERTKCIFGVTDCNDFRTKMSNLKIKYESYRYHRTFHTIRPMQTFISAEHVCSKN